MRLRLDVLEQSLTKDSVYTHDIWEENKSFPVLLIGRGSYITEAYVDCVLDENLIYQVQVGRYCSIAHKVIFLIDLDHDYHRICQGNLPGTVYHRPEYMQRKGDITIMNDCWIGTNVMLMPGITIGNGAVVAAHSVVTKDVPPYAIVAGNPARIIKYRFSPEQIDALELIRWWNWSDTKIAECSAELYSNDIEAFIQRHINDLKKQDQFPAVEIPIIPKTGSGEEKRLLYIPDFEQDYPTYPRVISAFADTFAESCCELLLYVKEDDRLEHHLELLNQLFEQYQDINCYINLFVENLSAELPLFMQSDAYITNRSIDNIRYVEYAHHCHIPVISSVNMPIFTSTSF